MSSRADHDTLAYRLTQMLIRLNQGDKLQPHALAQEFNVNLRTIQRDLNERFAYLPLEKTAAGYQLDPSYLGKLHYRDLERFACMTGIQCLYPALRNDFLRDLLDGHLESALLINSHSDLPASATPVIRQESELNTAGCHDHRIQANHRINTLAINLGAKIKDTGSMAESYQSELI